MRLIHAINEYFFDVEEGEPADYVSAAIFYGVCVIGVLTGVVPWIIL